MEKIPTYLASNCKYTVSKIGDFSVLGRKREKREKEKKKRKKEEKKKKKRGEGKGKEGKEKGEKRGEERERKTTNRCLAHTTVID